MIPYWTLWRASVLSSAWSLTVTEKHLHGDGVLRRHARYFTGRFDVRALFELYAQAVSTRTQHTFVPS